MDVVTIKLQKETSKEIERIVKEHNYGTKTEFIREAIRARLNELRKELAWEMLFGLKGKAKKRVGDRELERVREKVFWKLAKEKGWKLD